MQSRILLGLLLLILIGCAPQQEVPLVTPTPALAQELTIYHFDGGLSQAMIDTFSQRYNVKVNFQTFETYEEGAESILAGNSYDVVWLSNVQTGRLLEENLLAEIDYGVVTNARNIAENFRSTAFDPQNKHSIPWTWGTSGIVYRADLVDEPVTRWEDLWTLPPGKAGIWDDKRSMIGLTLRTLGYSGNTSNTAELEEAYNKLLELKARAVMLGETDPYTSAQDLANGDVYAALGWAYDALAGRELNPEIQYILPEEGSILWMETMAIPANTKNKYTAELFINYMLEPQTAAQFVNEYYYAVTVDAAKEFVNEDILNDPAVYPTTAGLVNSELLLPLPSEVQALYDDLWERYMAAEVEPVTEDTEPEATAEATEETTPEATAEGTPES